MSSHNGNLLLDAPGLARQLRNSLAPGDREAIAEIYRLACGAGALDEAPLVREAGVSYNPRPARIAQILVSECAESSPDVLGAAMLACALEPPTNATWPAPTVRALELACAARTWLEGGDAGSGEMAASSLRIALALVLDDLRHLHMNGVSAADRRVALERAQRISAGRTVSAAGGRENSAESRLRILIEACLGRLARGGLV